MIDTVIFDMDGVIIDSEPLHMEAEQEIFRTIGISISGEKHATFVGTSSRNMWEIIIREHSLTTPIDTLMEQNKLAYRKRLAVASGAAVPGVTELIRNLHASGLKLAVASSSVPEDIETVLAMYSLRSYFTVVVSGSNVEYSKPHPEIFLKTAQLLKSEPDHCLVIEDSENGVRAAKSAGMKCIGFRNVNTGNQNLGLADKIVDSIDEISIDLIRTTGW
jgi:beta-phosphoglucomutase family hydrolase